jgi:hypothetical protein
MCFRLDGENTLTACQPEPCRERLRGAGTPLAIASGGEPDRLAAGSVVPNLSESDCAPVELPWKRAFLHVIPPPLTGNGGGISVTG